MPISAGKFKVAFGLLESGDESVDKAVELISHHIGLIESLVHVDPLGTLTRALNGSKKVIAKLGSMDSDVVQSHLTILKGMLPPVERLIKQIIADDGDMEEGRQLVRKAMVDGDLHDKITNPKFAKAVKAWLDGVGDEPDFDTKDDIIGLFQEDLIEGVLKKRKKGFLQSSSQKAMDTLFDSALGLTDESELPREEIESMSAYLAMGKSKRQRILDKYRETDEEKQARLIREDKARGETYLSSGYRSINPLLAAFDALKVDPSVHRSPDYNYTAIQSKLLLKWREIAQARGMADKKATDAWDLVLMAETYEFVRAMARVWDDFKVPDIPGNAVARGDTGRFMYAAYPALDPTKNGLGDGEHSVGITITWPSIMSTTMGDPKEHNFITAKTFIWKFSVTDGHPGRVIGTNNASEAEVTFPVGVTVSINKLVIRTGDDKSLKAGEFGSTAEVIAYARLS